MTCYGNWKLPDTGQTVSYSTAVGDDAHYHPAAVQPSYTVFSVNSASVTLDNITGLMWIYNRTDAGIDAFALWDNALGVCKTLNYAGYTDWRLPNVRELTSIVDYGRAAAPANNTAAFFNTGGSPYWTSTTSRSPTTSAFNVAFNDAGKIAVSDKGNSWLVRCVRGGQ